MVDKFTFAMTSSSKGQSEASEGTLIDLLQTCLNDQFIIVLDGVDECKDSDSFITSLLRLSLVCNPKILILSRVNVSRLQRSVPPEARLAIPKRQLSSDIRRYCRRELEELADDEILPEVALSHLDQLTDHLVNGADGMFLWARLMIEFLRSPALSQERRLKTITEINFPEGLEKMYERIFMLIHQSGRTAQTLAIQIFTWLAFCTAPVTTHQLRQALAIDGIWSSASGDEKIDEFESAVIMACRGLVELVPVSGLSQLEHTLKFVHLTAREILTSRNHPATSNITSVAQYSIAVTPPSVSNLKLGRCCLQQLTYHTPSQPLAATFHQSISASSLKLNHPFADYSALYWMDHVAASIVERSEIVGQDGQINASFEAEFHGLTEDLQRFLDKPKLVTAWLEIYYTACQNRHLSGNHLRDWATWALELSQETSLRVTGVLLGLIFEFRSDLDRIVKVWGDTLRMTPHVVWDEATATGLVSSNIFFSPGSTRVTSRAPERPDLAGPMAAMSSRAMCSLSATSVDGHLLGVLSIWWA